MGQLLKEIQPQDLLKFGIIPELVGRLPVITTLRSLGREQMVQILTEPKNSLVKQYRKLMEYDDVDLEFTPEALEAVAGRAVERGIGARGLRAILEEVMTRIMYDVPSDPEVVKVTITEDCIRSGAAPEILRDPEHSQRPALGRRTCGLNAAVCPVPTRAERIAPAGAVSIDPAPRPPKRRARGCCFISVPPFPHPPHPALGRRRRYEIP